MPTNLASNRAEPPSMDLPETKSFNSPLETGVSGEPRSTGPDILHRRRFIRGMVGIAGVGLGSIALAACGDSPTPANLSIATAVPTPTPNPPTAATSQAVSTTTVAPATSAAATSTTRVPATVAPTTANTTGTPVTTTASAPGSEIPAGYVQVAKLADVTSRPLSFTQSGKKGF